jgi:hypothetical protein
MKKGTMPCTSRWSSVLPEQQSSSASGFVNADGCPSHLQIISNAQLLVVHLLAVLLLFDLFDQQYVGVQVGRGLGQHFKLQLAVPEDISCCLVPYAKRAVRIGNSIQAWYGVYDADVPRGDTGRMAVMPPGHQR